MSDNSKVSRLSCRADLLCETGILAANMLTLVLPLVIVQLFDRVIPNNARETLTVLGMALAGAIVLEGVLRSAVGKLMAASAERYEIDAQERLVDSILRDGGTAERQQDPSSLLEAFETIERVRAFHAENTRHTRFDIPFAMLFLLAFWYVAPPLFVAMLSVLAITFLGSALTRRLSLKLTEGLRDQRKRSLSLSSEILNSIEHLKGLRAEPFMLRRMESLHANSAKTTEKLVLTNSIGKVVNEVAAQATPLVIAVFGAVSVIQGTISSGALAAAILLSGRIVQPFLRQQQFSGQQRLLGPSIQSLNALLEADETLVQGRPIEKIDKVEMQELYFDAQDGRTILTGVNLVLEANECVVITGKSGAGKSLLLKLLVGEVTPKSGQVRINGVPVSQTSSLEFGRKIGLMSQTPNTPTGSALDIVTGFAGKGKLADALPVIEELGLSEFFASNPEGFMVKVGGTVSRGVPSAIEARLPLVGTLTRGPELLLFDEANGPLDRESDQYLLSALQRRKGTMSMVIVTQRPSYAALADRCYALEDGRLIEIDAADFGRRIVGDMAA